MRVLELDVELDSGKVVTWEVADKGGDSVAIVPITDAGEVYLVEEYFAATDERSLCLPKGKIDDGEDAEIAATRELREEIGQTGTLRHLITMSVSPGYLTQRTHVFVATELEESAAEGDEEHHLQPVRIRLDDVMSRARNGDIAEARTIGALALVVAMREELGV
jgi:8-oxo-dGTP pyrophosphatase MutT (NUDIX family)